MNRDVPFYVVKDEQTLKGLPQFLHGLGFQYTAHEDEFDKTGNPLFRLYYDKYPNKDHAWGVEKRGIVVVRRKDFVPQVKDAIQAEIKRYEAEYAA
ncbi:MAG: hypothetical protein WAL34_04250 [Acidobacteriaceae bacterium]